MLLIRRLIQPIQTRICPLTSTANSGQNCCTWKSSTPFPYSQGCNFHREDYGRQSFGGCGYVWVLVGRHLSLTKSMWYYYYTLRLAHNLDRCIQYTRSSNLLNLQWPGYSYKGGYTNAPLGRGNWLTLTVHFQWGFQPSFVGSRQFIFIFLNNWELLYLLEFVDKWPENDNALCCNSCREFNIPLQTELSTHTPRAWRSRANVDPVFSVELDSFE